PEINPKTIHEWTYYVVKNFGKPIHFTKISDLIKKESPKKEFNIKTIHNVLISDSRFVLVGNGLYALKEWGYEPGTVADVIVRIFKKEKRPLNTQEITEKVLKERIVKKNTILVNLQNRKLFKKVARATYQLADNN
ncbi:MAG: HTH domain-containing protein, partial [Minisyncoccia bacterium]